MAHIGVTQAQLDRPRPSEVKAELQDDLKRLLDKSVSDEDAGIPPWLTREETVKDIREQLSHVTEEDLRTGYWSDERPDPRDYE